MISVIIPTCNRNDLLSKCLDAIDPKIQSISIYTYEVIVTDDSQLNVAKRLIEEEYSWVKWVEGPKKGPAANRNNGARHAKGSWLVFIDDDCLPQKNWLSTYMEAIHTTDYFVLEGATTADRPKKRFDEEAPINTNGDKLWSCNFAIAKDIFNTLNGFDELFPYAAMEDVDFYTRVKKLTKIKFVPEALVIHPWRRVKPFRNFKKHLKSHNYYATKYHLKGTADYRLSRVKIFAGGVWFEFKNLITFSMKGWLFYIENCFLNFCMVFI